MMGTKVDLKGVNLIFFLALFYSCSQIKLNTPSSRFISPEAHGKLYDGAIRVEQQASTRAELNLEDSSTSNPLKLSHDNESPAASLELGIIDQLDFILKGNSNSAAVYTFKYQVLGEPRAKATKGNNSLALTLGYGREEFLQTESKGLFELDESNIEALIDQAILEASIIYGYRPHEDTLVYTSFQVSKIDTSIKLDSEGSSLDQKRFSLNTWTYGLSVGGTRYFTDKFLTAEASVQNTNWTNNDPTTFAFLTLAFGYLWD